MMAISRDTIRFVLDDVVIEAKDVAPTTTVLEFLRTKLGRTGTKEGCAEGDCGACTVVLGELDEREGIRYRAINSCIRFLPTIDGRALITSESLADEDELHPVQRAMVDNHASQCGFCTPGFVMSLFALYLHEPAATRDQVLSTLAGNLCRCTGYRPIIDAGCAMNRYPEPERWSRTDAQSQVRRKQLTALKRSESLRARGFQAPRSVDELAVALAAEPQSLILAGGTDIGLWSTKNLRELAPLIYIGEVAELQRIEDRPEAGLWIGAAVSLTDAWASLVRIYPQLSDLALRFASPPVCNSGTLCGNIANGSPIGDAMPILMALDARIDLRQGSTLRTVPLDQFYLGYQRKDLRAGEFVTGVLVPQHSDLILASYKVSKRFDQDITAVCMGIALRMNGGTIEHARLAYGGMAAVPARALAAERALTGAPWALSTFEAAGAALTQDYEPLSDFRASRDYRLQVASNLLLRFYHEHADASCVELRRVSAHG